MGIRLSLDELLVVREELGTELGENSMEVHQADGLVRTMGRRATGSIGIVNPSSGALFQALVERGYTNQDS